MDSALNYVPVVGVLRGMHTANKRALTIPLHYEFIISDVSLSCPIVKDKPLRVEWMHGTQLKALSESSLCQQGKCVWVDSLLQIKATMYKQNNSTTFLKNKSHLHITAPSLKNKLIAIFDLDLGTHAGFLNKHVSLHLKKPFEDMKNSVLSFVISSKEIIKEKGKEDSMSESKLDPPSQSSLLPSDFSSPQDLQPTSPASMNSLPFVHLHIADKSNEIERPPSSLSLPSASSSLSSSASSATTSTASSFVAPAPSSSSSFVSPSATFSSSHQPQSNFFILNTPRDTPIGPSIKHSIDNHSSCSSASSNSRNPYVNSNSNSSNSNNHYYSSSNSYGNSGNIGGSCNIGGGGGSGSSSSNVSSETAKTPVISFALSRVSSLDTEELEDEINKLKEQLKQSEEENEKLQLDNNSLIEENNELQQLLEESEEKIREQEEKDILTKQAREHEEELRKQREEQDREDKKKLEQAQHELLIQQELNRERQELDREKKQNEHTQNAHTFAQHTQSLAQTLKQKQQEQESREEQFNAKMKQMQADRDTLIQVNVNLQEQVATLQDRLREQASLQASLEELTQARQREVDQHAIEKQKLEFSFNEIHNQNQQLWTKLADSGEVASQQRIKELETQMQEAIHKMFDVKAAWIDSQQILDEKETELQQLRARLSTCVCGTPALQIKTGGTAKPASSSSSTSATSTSSTSTSSTSSGAWTSRNVPRVSVSGIMSGVTNVLHKTDGASKKPKS